MIQTGTASSFRSFREKQIVCWQRKTEQGMCGMITRNQN